jgi:hypothetical protein
MVCILSHAVRQNVRDEAASVVASKYFGIVTTRNVLDLGRSDVWAVPAALLAYLIDT